MEIRRTEIEVDKDTLTANIDAGGNGIYIVHRGEVVMYPLPKYGKIEIASQNFKISRPKYLISAD